ncbi:hypothetical protein GIB67_028253, partial [Kingdonia uniflora]
LFLGVSELVICSLSHPPFSGRLFQALVAAVVIFRELSWRLILYYYCRACCVEVCRILRLDIVILVFRYFCFSLLLCCDTI